MKENDPDNKSTDGDFAELVQHQFSGLKNTPNSKDPDDEITDNETTQTQAQQRNNKAHSIPTAAAVPIMSKNHHLQPTSKFTLIKKNYSKDSRNLQPGDIVMSTARGN